MNFFWKIQVLCFQMTCLRCSNPIQIKFWKNSKNPFKLLIYFRLRNAILYSIGLEEFFTIQYTMQICSRNRSTWDQSTVDTSFESPILVFSKKKNNFISFDLIDHVFWRVFRQNANFSLFTLLTDQILHHSASLALEKHGK